MRCVLHTEFPPLPITLASLIETMANERCGGGGGGENISVYIDSTGSGGRGGRGWVTHLLHLDVEEGGGGENVSTEYFEYIFTSRLDRYMQ